MVLLGQRGQGESPRRPRTRGDGPKYGVDPLWGDLSAPHARGWSFGLNDIARFFGVGPARAGMVRRATSSPWPATRRPRTRGDGPPSSFSTSPANLSAPHARGWSAAGVHSTWSPCRPRTRGDGPRRRRMAARSMVSAPHARGWSAQGVSVGGGLSVGPARAGMVRRTPGENPHRGSRPRTRGDGPEIRACTNRGCGSAPHARGWSLGITLRQDSRAVGPARAGMVRWRRA